MTQPDPIDTTLAELRQSFADISTMINIAIALRRNSGHLLTLLRSMMIDLCEQIGHAVALRAKADHFDALSQLPILPLSSEEKAHAHALKDQCFECRQKSTLRG
jgi:hypothetical protein